MLPPGRGVGKRVERGGGGVSAETLDALNKNAAQMKNKIIRRGIVFLECQFHFKSFKETFEMEFLFRSAQTRVHYIAHCIANQIPAQHEKQERHAGIDDNVPILAQVRNPIA